jgi:phage tail sheath gpL-like
MNFYEIPTSRRTPGTETEVNTRGASKAPPSTRQRLMVVGQRMSALISTPSFVPSSVPGLNDCVLGTGPAPTFTGSLLRKFIIEISTEATPDTFKWSKDNGVNWTTGVSCSTSNITLVEGVTVKFGATTGHKAGDRWTFVAFPAGTQAQATPRTVFTAGEASAYFGQGSILHRMVKIALETAQQHGGIEINCTAMDDAAGTAATGYLQFTGTATAPGSARFRLGNDVFEASYAIGATPDSIALSIKTELDKNLDLAVVSHRLAGTLARVVLTGKNLGTLLNELKMSIEVTPNTGVTAAINGGTSTGAMGSGATDPTNLDAALDSFQGERYHVIANSLSDASNLTLLAAHLNTVSSSTEKKYAIGLAATNNATYATVVARATGLNHERCEYVWVKGSYSPGFEILAAFAAVKTYYDNPTYQLNGKQLFGLHVPVTADRISETEIESALWNGVTPTRVDAQGRIAIVRAITTDVSHDFYVDITTVTGLDYFRTAFVARCDSVFEGAKNTPDMPGKLLTQARFVAKQLEAKPLEVLRDVDKHWDEFAAEQDPADPNRANVACPSAIVPGLHRICTRFDLIWG